MTAYFLVAIVLGFLLLLFNKTAQRMWAMSVVRYRLMPYVWAALVFGIVVSIAWDVEADSRFWAACYKAGGKKVNTGSHVQMMMVGKVMVPVTIQHYGCRV